MIKISFLLLAILVIFAVCFTSCSDARKVILDNRELIQIIIKTIVDTLINQATMTSSVNQGMSKSNDQVVLSKMTYIVQSESFWNSIQPKIDDIIKNYSEGKTIVSSKAR